MGTSGKKGTLDRSAKLNEDRSQPTCTKDIRQIIRDAPFEAHPWRSFISALRTAVSASTVGLTLQQPAVTRPLILFEMKGDFDNSSMMHRYLSIYSDQDPFPYEDLEPRRLYTLSDLLGDDWEQSSYHVDFMRDFGFYHMLLARLVVPGRIDAFLNIGRAASGGLFSQADRRYVSNILPDVEYGLLISSALKRLDTERLLYESAVEMMGIGTIVLDSTGYMVYISPLALDIIINQSNLILSGKKLTCSRTADHRMMTDAVDSALNDRTGKFARALPLSDGDLLLAVRSVTYPLSVHNEPGPRVTMFLSDRFRAPNVTREAIASLFGLTTTEADLSVKLVQGASLAEASQIMGISENTARTYSKRIFSKTGTSRQAELVQVILTSVARLTGKG